MPLQPAHSQAAELVKDAKRKRSVHKAEIGIWLILIVMVLAPLMGGCASVPQPPKSGQATSDSLAGAKQNIMATTRAMTAAKPHSNVTGQAILDQGLGSATAGLKNIDDGKAVLDSFIADYWKVWKELTWAEGTLGFRIGQWVKKVAWILGISGVSLLILSIIARALMPVGVVSRLAGFFLGFLPQHAQPAVDGVVTRLAKVKAKPAKAKKK